MAYSSRCSLFVGQKHYDDAISDCQKAIDYNPQDTAAYNNLGRAYFFKGERFYSQALTALKTAISIDSEKIQPYFGLWLIGMQNHSYSEALNACNKTLQLNPESALLYTLRCITNGAMNRYDEALDDCSRAIVINPDYAFAYLYRSFIYAAKGEKKLATQDINNAEALGQIPQSTIDSGREFIDSKLEAAEKLESFFSDLARDFSESLLGTFTGSNVYSKCGRWVEGYIGDGSGRWGLRWEPCPCGQPGCHEQ